jgi:hypothetical protein
VFQALAGVGLHAEPAVYHDDFCGEVHRQLMQQQWVPQMQKTLDIDTINAALHRPGDPCPYPGRLFINQGATQKRLPPIES